MIDIDSGNELGILPDPSKGSIPNPKIPLEEVRPFRIRDNSMRGKQDIMRVLVLV